MKIALAIPPLTVKKRGGVLIRDHAHNRANTINGSFINTGETVET